MREVKEKSPLKERAAETFKSAPQAALHVARMLPFSSFGRSCARRRRTGSRKIATRAARSQTPPTMPCRKSAIWQKRQPTGCRKRSLNRKPGQNLFHNMSSLGTPCSLLRYRGNIHRKASHREISLCANRLLQSGRSRFLRQATSSLLVYRRSLR